MGDQRYKAFISYSHADEAWGARLQNWLERYRVPSAIAGKGGARARLSPVFRDREDLPVAGSLNAAIQAALADSECQIVLCSPNAAASRWVNEEIKLFHKLHGPGRTFALIIAGEPNASAIKGRESEECFPPALRFALDADGAVTATPAEALAADAREAGDGKRYALLKVAAGMLGVGLDDLVRRDAQRRTRSASVLAASSLAVAGAFAFTTIAAVTARNEARTARGKAEDLIEFMLTDLRDKLEPVGKIDILKSVSDEAMEYYADQNLKSLDDGALARRAKAMIQLGDIDQRRNDLGSAYERFTAAEEATAELLRKAPNDPQRIFDHAQAVFYVGAVFVDRNDLAGAKRQYEEYLRLAERLLAIDPDDQTARLELAYATSNLGSVLQYSGDYAAAIDNYRKSADIRRKLVAESPSDRELRDAYAYVLSWQAYAEMGRGGYAQALRLIEEQLAVYGKDAGPQSENYEIFDAVVAAQRRRAESHLALGEIATAEREIEQAAATAERLMARDAENATWRVNAMHIERARAYLLDLAGKDGAAIAAADRAIGYAVAACRPDACEASARANLIMALARRLPLGGDAREVARIAGRIDGELGSFKDSGRADSAAVIGPASLELVRYDRKAGRGDRAMRRLRIAIARLSANETTLTPYTRICFAGLLVEKGDLERAAQVVQDLDALGIRHPDLLELKRNIQRIARN